MSGRRNVAHSLLVAAMVAAGVAAVPAAANAETSTIYLCSPADYTGNPGRPSASTPQSWTAPDGVSSASFVVDGAAGTKGGGLTPWGTVTAVGAPGGRTEAVLKVTPRQIYTIEVGCTGQVSLGGLGFGNGGNGGPAADPASFEAGGFGGGGGSAVLLDQTPLLVAGGGGGSAHSDGGGWGGGQGGGTNGLPGGSVAEAGGGGTQAAPGVGGTSGDNTGSGSAGVGHDGGTGAPGGYGGGGGGGGWFGGGGGAVNGDGVAGGGGGGSGFAADGLDATLQTGYALNCYYIRDNCQAIGDGRVTITYTVAPWTLKGFYAPVDMPPTVNTVKGGSTVPLKFNVYNGSTELTTTTAIGATFTTKAGSCTGGTQDAVEFTTTGNTELTYTGGAFQQNWKTPKTPGCYTVTLTTADGSTRSALFQLK